MGRSLKLLLAGALLLVGILGISQRFAQGQTKDSSTVTPAEFLGWKDKLKTWGRWGADDQRGMTNLITAQKVLSAVRLVKTGQVISLAHPVPQQEDAEVPASAVFHRTTNAITASGTTDNYQVSYHGLALSHMDSFCHIFTDGKMYNGIPVAGNITPETGCKKDGIMVWKDGIVTRAVLYDMPQLKGVDWIEPGTPITRADFEAWEKKSGAKAGPGDLILLYVGRWKRRALKGPSSDASAGYYPDVIPWIHDREIAFIGHDSNIDWRPRAAWTPENGIPGPPIHIAVLNWMGVNIIENLDLEQLVETARRLKRYDFMVTFAPIPVEGGTGSPINPLAVF
jgi:kynurenine formamidase